ncbi:MAG: hypothetical protein ABJ242_11510 [Marinomonas sp.]
MQLPDTFSRRKRLQRGSVDPLVYDEVPIKARNQVLQILDQADRISGLHQNEKIYETLTDGMRKELGVMKLAGAYSRSDEFSDWFVNHPITDEVLDAVELVCRVILALVKMVSTQAKAANLKALVQEINDRFLEQSIGYQFENGRMIQVDSQFGHKEIVVPALQLLSDSAYEAAEHEFLDAFDAFKEGNYETTLHESFKSLESTIKVIGSQKDWGLDENATLKTLLKVVFEKELIPGFMESEFTGLRTVLQSGVGTVRNKASGHGAGQSKRTVPKHVAAFQLHQTAAAIILLVEASKA